MTLITQAECNRAYLEADQFVGREPWEDEKFPVGLNDTGEDSRAPHGEVGHHLGAAEEAGIRVEDIIESVNEIRKIMLNKTVCNCFNMQWVALVKIHSFHPGPNYLHWKMFKSADDCVNLQADCLGTFNK